MTTASKGSRGRLRGPIYLDSSAAVKLYLPEADSDSLEALLLRRRDLCLSSLAVTEIVSAAARRRREGHLSSADLARVHAALLDDLADQAFINVDLDSQTHRAAERLLAAAGDTPLRAANALHLALALAVNARTVITFDRRLTAAALGAGLNVFPQL